jgi:transposase-like protein
MARKKKVEPILPDAQIDALVAGATTATEMEAIFGQLKKRIIERMLAGELTHHLGYAPGAEKPADQTNHRNGSTPKTVITESGELPLEIPRDRAGSFAPQLVPKGVRRLPKFDTTVLSLYARGLTVREIQGYLEELYEIPIAPDVISTVTDEVIAEATAWQQRPLEPMYPVVILDAMRVKIRDEGTVRNKAVYLAIGVDREGRKDVLGLWIEQTEGAAFWLRVMTDLKSRGVEDILIALVDGLAGFPEAITTVFPQTQVHHCVVHLVRGSLSYVSYKDRKAVGAALRAIYRAPTEDAALAALAAFETSPWGTRYAPIATMWRRHWPHVRPVFAYPPEIRKLLYTTNAIESLHMQLRKIIKTRGHFPTDEAATKLLYLALRNILSKWKAASKEWRAAMPHLAVLFGERFTTEH